MMDERYVEAGRRAADTVTGKDPGKGHFYVSIVKSIIRIFAGIALIGTSFMVAGILFIVAEGLGILEEMI